MQATPESLQDNYRQLIRSCALVAALVHVGFIFLFASQGVGFLAAFNVLSVLAHGAAFHMARSQRQLRRAADLMGLEVLLHAAIATLTIGWETGFHYLFLPIAPVCMLSTQRPLAVRLSIALMAMGFYIALRIWTHRVPALYPIDSQLSDALHYGCVLTLFGFFIAMAARFRRVLLLTQARLTHEASTDPLTGALNRRRLHQVAKDVTGSLRSSAVLLCDLDHFKQVNDRHGHDAGDVVLQAFFQHLQAFTRPGDHISRWGGEEFLLLLPSTDAAQARSVAQRLCTALAATPVPLPDGQTLHITVTIGLTLLQPGEGLHTGVQRADAALYAGKAAGRNRVQEALAPTPQPTPSPAPDSGPASAGAVAAHTPSAAAPHTPVA